MYVYVYVYVYIYIYGCHKTQFLHVESICMTRDQIWDPCIGITMS